MTATSMSALAHPSHFVTSFPALLARDPLAGIAWLARLRETSIHRFGELGFPSTQQEEWRYTNVEPIAKTPFQLGAESAPDVGRDQLAPFSLATAGAELVFVNGRFARELSTFRALTDGVTVASLADAIRDGMPGLEPHLGGLSSAEKQAFTALNGAFVQDGAVIQLARGAVLEHPIHLVFVAVPGAEPVAIHPRVLVIAGEHGQASVIERFVALSSGVYLTNTVTEVSLGAGAVLDHTKIQNEATTAFHVASTTVHQERSSQFTSHWVSIGGALVRNEVHTVLDGEGASCTLDGLTLGTGAQHVDSQTVVDHAKPHCESHQLYKCVLDGSARSVFNGRVVVRPQAQKTNARQTNQNLLVSDQARADTKPQLEIHADDVKCSHGATIGKLDEAALFYLRSRGLSGDDARALLTYAFAGEVIGRIRVEPVREELDRLLASWLPRARASRESG